MKRPPGVWILLSAGVIWLSLQNVDGIRATSLIFGKSTTSTTEAVSESSVEISKNEASTDSTIKTSSNSTNSTNSNSTRVVTGIPQIDYLTDPNLPKELNGYNLSDYPFYDRVPDPEKIDFKCDGLHDGFYASIQTKCQVYHHCLFGTRYDFLCANYTAFDQKTFICQFVSDVDCIGSKKFWSRNDALYVDPTTTTVRPTVIFAPRGPSPFFSNHGGQRGVNRGASATQAPSAGGGSDPLSPTGDGGAPLDSGVQYAAPLGPVYSAGGRRRKPLRRPAYDYYDYAAEYEDDYVDDRPRPKTRRRRPRPRPRPVYDDEYDYDEDRYERRRPYDRRDRRRNKNRSKYQDEDEDYIDDDQRFDRRKENRKKRPTTLEDEDEPIPSRKGSKRPIDEDRPSGRSKTNKKHEDDDYADDELDERPSKGDDGRRNRPEKTTAKPAGSIYDRTRSPSRIKSEADKFSFSKGVNTKATSSTTELNDEEYYDDEVVDEKPKNKRTTEKIPSRTRSKTTKPTTTPSSSEEDLDKPRTRKPLEEDSSEKYSSRYRPKRPPTIKATQEESTRSKSNVDETTPSPPLSRNRSSSNKKIAPEEEPQPSKISNKRAKPNDSGTFRSKQNSQAASEEVSDEDRKENGKKDKSDSQEDKKKEQPSTTTSRGLFIKNKPNRRGTPASSSTTTTQSSKKQQDEYYDEEYEDELVAEKERIPSSTEALKHNRKTATTTTTTTTTTTPSTTTNQDESHKSDAVRIVKRPFLPSRGGSPYSRGLQPVGNKATSAEVMEQQSTDDNQSKAEEKPTLRHQEPQRSPPQEDYFKPSPVLIKVPKTRHEEVDKSQAHVRLSYKTEYTPLPPLKTTPRPKIVEKNPLDIVSETEYDVTLNDALNPTLPNLPVRSFPTGFSPSNDYTFSAFQRQRFAIEPVISSANTDYVYQKPIQQRQRYSSIQEPQQVQYASVNYANGRGPQNMQRQESQQQNVYVRTRVQAPQNYYTY